MIKHFIFVIFLLFSLCVLPSCTIFGGSHEEEGEGTEEDYYPDEEENEEEAEGMEGEDQDLSQAEEGGEGDSFEMSSQDSTDDIEYIDEEDEEFLEEGALVMDDTEENREDLGSVDEESAVDNVDESSSEFFSADTSTQGKEPSSLGTVVTPAPKKWVSYKKIKNKPYNMAGFLINAVYIAREGDSGQSISQKIFGSDQVEKLYAINPYLKARSVKTGDKIYYPSPNRPQDSSQLLFYFEDKGIPPQYHQGQAGENIRTIASSLLGHQDSWKEIWATNPDLESKGQLNQAITIKYWSKGADSAPQEVEEPMEEPSESPAMGGEPESPDPSGLEPPVEEDSGLEDEGLTPEPPQAEDMPEDEGSNPLLDDEENRSDSGNNSGGFSQTDMAVAGFLALGALLLCVILVKRKWKKKSDFDYTAVNYEINED